MYNVYTYDVEIVRNKFNLTFSVLELRTGDGIDGFGDAMVY